MLLYAPLMILTRCWLGAGVILRPEAAQAHPRLALTEWAGCNLHRPWLWGPAARAQSMLCECIHTA